jgi:flagellar protein FlaF
VTQYDLARTAYSAAGAPVRTPRSIEYEAFARVTRRLKQASEGSGDFADLVRALHENRRLWIMLALHVADAANELPSGLRARLFYLAEFTSETTSKVLRKEADATILVEINAAVMRGLRTQAAVA